MDRLAHGAAIQAARIASNATRADLAAASGLTRARIRDIELGASAPDGTIARISAALDCNGAPFATGSARALLRLAEGPGVLLEDARASLDDLRLLLHQGLVWLDRGRVRSMPTPHGDTTR